MSDPYLGEIQSFAISYVPANWLICNGQLLQIRQFATLYSLIGTIYGGDGTNTFAVPNLVGATAMSQGQGPALSMRTIGAAVGSNTETLGYLEMPAHRHPIQLGNKNATNGTAGPTATSNVAIDPNFNGFAGAPSTTSFSGNAITLTGGSQPHPNNQPTLAMVYCICTSGVYPPFTS